MHPWYYIVRMEDVRIQVGFDYRTAKWSSKDTSLIEEWQLLSELACFKESQFFKQMYSLKSHSASKGHILIVYQVKRLSIRNSKIQVKAILSPICFSGNHS